tara:strand:- start:123 stop:224 length:102 start_codon:yes stop_codon:yes gene_type:complete
MDLTYKKCWLDFFEPEGYKYLKHGKGAYGQKSN